MSAGSTACTWVYGCINQKCPGVALRINPARVSGPVPIRVKPTQGRCEWLLMDDQRTFLPLLSPHRFCPFDVSDPPVDGQGQAWIAGDGLPHFKCSTRKELRFKFDYIWITETRSKNLLPHMSCLSDLLPQIPKSLSECKLRLHSSGPVRSDRV